MILHLLIDDVEYVDDLEWEADQDRQAELAEDSRRDAAAERQER